MKKLKDFFLRLSLFKQIGVAVLFFHFLLLLFLTGDYLLRWKRPLHSRIAVRTFSTPKPVISNTPKTPPPKPKSPAPKPRPSHPEKPPPQKKTAPSQSVKNPAKPSTKPPPTATSNPSQTDAQDMIAEISKSLEALSAPSLANSHSDLSLPSQIPVQTSFETISLADASSGEILVAFLQNALQLPEYGDVVVQIEIDALGHLVFCEILKTQSRKNGEFLKKRLPELHFPCFNKSIEFTLTFRNVENL